MSEYGARKLAGFALVLLLQGCGGTEQSDALTATGGNSPLGGATNGGGRSSSVAIAGQGGATVTGSSSGNALGGATSAALLTMPAECQVMGGSASSSASSSIIFRVNNPGPDPVYRSRCGTVEIYSCADGYSEPLPRGGSLLQIPCDSSGGYCGGGGCEELAEGIAVGGAEVAVWSGRQVTGYGMHLSGCSCYYLSTSPAGKYRATFVISDNASQSATFDYATARTLTVDFVYPDDDGVVAFEP